MKFSNEPIHKFYYHDQWVEKHLIEDCPLNDLPTIPNFYANQEIFITGGTGFIGKALIEKLLRSCPDIKAIYLLIRPKKGKTAADRLKSTCDSVIFDLLKRKNPNFMDKLIAVAGDVAELDLGMSDDDKQRLKNVSIVFHSAASVRFDDPIKDAVFMNTRGTHEVLKLCETFNDIKSVIHISTAYCNCYLSTIEEQIYPGLADWRKVIEICEKMGDNENLNILSPHMTSFMPNTYTFTKQLAECVVEDYKDKLPIAIVRPSVIVNAVDEPMGGYIDNLNGAIGLCLGISTGVIKTLYCNPDHVMDMVSIDIVVKANIIAAWRRAFEEPGSLRVYNAAFAAKQNLSLQKMCDLVTTGGCEEFPMGPKMLFLPSFDFSLWKSKILIKCFLFQLLPAMFLDFLISFSGKKLSVMKIQRKAYEASKAIKYFITHDWTFEGANFDSLSSILKSDDVRAFDIRKYENYSTVLISRGTVYGMRRYLLNLKDEDLEKDRRRLKIMKMISFVLKSVILIGLIYLILCRFKDNIVDFLDHI
ncbi:putative fatty acyl-CoA reductase CG5065 [Chironomus tepperi]|uniref:putative fatty acyl-CoA reductase CG5065 n=1 Tax=Chironomus tepperi TaxID=113505 RepID=UPI00391F6FD9